MTDKDIIILDKHLFYLILSRKDIILFSPDKHFFIDYVHDKDILF